MFEKSSLRTRLSFYLAIKQLGGGTITLRSNELHLGEGGESLEDTAKILSTYGDGFMLRTDSDKKIDDFKKYLISEKFIETKSKVIMDLAQKLAPKRSKGGILLHSIFNSTIKNLDKYNFANEPKGALGALKLGGGDCTDYTDLFVSLCRSRGLPARHVHGILASGFSDTPKHSWAEVYIPHNGWVRLDPFLVEAGKASFRRLKNYYITLNHDRNDGIYSKDNGVWYWRYYYWGDPIAISEKLDCGYGVFSERVSSIKGDK